MCDGIFTLNCYTMKSCQIRFHLSLFFYLLFSGLDCVFSRIPSCILDWIKRLWAKVGLVVQIKMANQTHTHTHTLQRDIPRGKRTTHPDTHTNIEAFARNSENPLSHTGFHSVRVFIVMASHTHTQRLLCALINIHINAHLHVQACAH